MALEIVGEQWGLADESEVFTRTPEAMEEYNVLAVVGIESLTEQHGAIIL
jgi:hypothetical protein